MKILHINCNYIGTTLHQLMAEELDKKNIKNEVFVPTYNKNIAVIKPNDNVYVSECYNKWDRFFFDYKQKKIIEAIEAHYDVASADLIHAYTLFTDGNAARVLSEKYHIPYVVAVRNTDVNDFFRLRKNLKNRGIKNLIKADKVFFLSESYKKTVFDKYLSKKNREIVSKKVEVIPNGIDDFWFENFNGDKNKNRDKEINLVYAGVINRNKNITATQEAMKILRQKGIECNLTVVGKVLDKKIYEIVTSDAYTKVLPATDKKNLINIYRCADIFVMPSITESFGLVYAEAMTQGLPVIYTAGQGFDGQFEEGSVGYSVNCHDANDIADKIVKCVKNYSSISKNLVGVYKFKWDKICDKYIDIYKEIEKGRQWQAP